MKMSVPLTPAVLARGYVVPMPGAYALEQSIFVSVPALPDATNWHAFAQGRPCAVSVRADDVTLDLGGFTLAASTEHSRGLVLVHVARGVKNFQLLNGGLATCNIGVFLEEGCVAALLQGVSVYDFLEKGVLSYSPQGLTLRGCAVGPNLSSFATMSQELYALVLYGSAVRPKDVCAWQRFSDDSSTAEASHVVGVAVVPDAAHDAPFPVETDTGSGVVLEDVRVAKLTMNFREHSLLVSVGAVTNAVTKPTGALGEVLPEWYLLRRAAARRLQLGYYPPLEEPQRAFITDAHGFLLNTGDAPASEPQVTAWVRGVDREGNAVRGVQAVLIVGAGKPMLTNVVAETPVFATLPPRVLLPAPKFVERLDLASAKRAFALLVLPAPVLPERPCCPTSGAAAYFSQERVQFNVQPQGNVNPLVTGSVSGVNAVVNFV
jgi:hypothetical protein